jgi:hypothetical protein
MNDKKYTVWILWGLFPEDDEPENYHFDTEIELKAFIKGVETGIGWQTCSHVISNTKPDKTEFENYIE